MKFGKIDNFIIFGGNRTLAGFSKMMKENGYKFVVFSSERHLSDEIEHRVKLKDFLKSNGIKYYCSDDINKDNRVDKFITKGTFALSFDAAWIFKKEFIEKFKGKFLNSHGARLPQYRGGGGYSWQIMRKNRCGYSLLHKIDPGIDTGDIVKFREFIFPPTCNTPNEYFDVSYENDMIMLNEFIEELIKGKDFKTVSQQEYFSIYFPRLNTKKHGFINWNMNTEEIELFICAFDDPYPGASTFINGKRVFLKKVYTEFSDGPFHPFQSGLVYRKSKDALFVATRNGTLIVKEIIYEDSSSAMGDIKLGDRFYTPQKHIEESMLFRAVYTSKGLKGDTITKTDSKSSPQESNTSLSNTKNEINIEGKNIFLKKMRVADVTDDYCKWMNDPKIMKYLESRFTHHTIESLKKYVQDKEKKGDEIIFAIISKRENKHIGNIKIGPINKIHKFADIGLLIGNKSFWGRGIATEAIGLIVDYAFNKLNIHKLMAGVYSENIASIKAFKKNGFKEEGISRKQYLCNGKYVDRINLGILKNDFEKKNKKNLYEKR